MAGTSRMSREAHVRICGGLEVKFLRSTRPAKSGLLKKVKSSAIAANGRSVIIVKSASSEASAAQQWRLSIASDKSCLPINL